MRFDQCRLELRRRFVLGNRARIIARIAQHHTQIAVQFGGVWFELHRRAKRVRGTRKILRAHVQRTERDIQFGIFRIQTRRFDKRADRIVDIITLLQRNAQIDPAFKVVVVQINRLAKGRDGFNEVSTLRQRESERVVCCGAFRIAFDRRAQLLERNGPSLGRRFRLGKGAWNEPEQNDDPDEFTAETQRFLRQRERGNERMRDRDVFSLSLFLSLSPPLVLLCETLRHLCVSAVKKESVLNCSKERHGL